jgi:hypothetical protein
MLTITPQMRFLIREGYNKTTLVDSLGLIVFLLKKSLDNLLVTTSRSNKQLNWYMYIFFHILLLFNVQYLIPTA